MKRTTVYFRSLVLVMAGLGFSATARANEPVNVKMANSYDLSASHVANPGAPEENTAQTADAPAKNQPVDGTAAGFVLPNPGESVLGSDAAPAFRIQNAQPKPETAGTSWPPVPLIPVLALLAGIAPALLWISWSRSRDGKKAKAVGGPNPLADAVRRKLAATDVPVGSPEAGGRRKSAPEPEAPRIQDPELQSLRLEVMGGLKEMRARTEAFTDALETGLAELQTELSRARRTVILLREERVRWESRLENAGEAPEDVIELFEQPGHRRAPAPPAVEETGTIFRDADPALDPAWLLLDDPSPGIVTRESAPPAAAPAIPGEKALKAFAGRPAPAPDDFRRALDFTTPSERREMILGLARAGQSIDEIARQVKVGRGEVTLALTRAQGAAARG